MRRAICVTNKQIQYKYDRNINSKKYGNTHTNTNTYTCTIGGRVQVHQTTPASQRPCEDHLSIRQTNENANVKQGAKQKQRSVNL